MTIADTLLFVGLLALALWLQETRLLLMAAVVAIAAGISAAALNPSPWIGISVFAIGVYLLVSTIKAMLAARKSRREGAASNHSMEEQQ